MIENVKGKVLLIFVVLAVSAAFLVLGRVRPDLGIQLGLDLQGGQRFVYRLEFDEAQVRDEDPGQLQRQTLEIIRDRIDPDGVKEPVLVPLGSNRIAIEIPGVDELQGAEANATLAESFPEGGDGSEALVLTGVAGVFPAAGGEIAVGTETVRYSEAIATKATVDGATADAVRLVVAANGRGYQGTPRAAHEPGESVRLVSTNYVQNKIENLGQLSFDIMVRNEVDLQGSGTDLAAERAKLDAWLAVHSQAVSLREFNELPPTVDPSDPNALAGPSPWIRWVPEKKRLDESGRVADTRTLADRAQPLLRLENIPEYSAKNWNWTGRRLLRAFPSRDQRGLPAIGFEWQSRYASAFGAFTKAFKGYQMAIVLNEQIESAPSLDEPIYASGIIRSGSVPYRPEEVDEMVTVLRTGSLVVRPVLESKESVGPTLGTEYVRLGWISGLVGLLLVLAYMWWYYRRLGFFSVISLVANMFIVMGALSFLNATLTLPGIAGLVLTIGMAVDANILIFDRIREERDNGRNIKQAAKNGFEKAAVAIVDSNLTTLITALVLYNFGTGPVKGFAVTLAIGILASMFAALVLTRVLVHFALERGVKEFKMGTWLVEANYKWMKNRRAAYAGSATAIVAGLALFVFVFLSDPGRIIGIDFLSGAETQVRTEQATTKEAMEELTAKSSNPIVQGTVFRAVASSARSGGYTEFRATAKISSTDSEEQDSLVRNFSDALVRTLAPVLQKGPVDIDPRQPDGSVSLRIYFEAAHPVDEVTSRLADRTPLTDIACEQDPNRPNVFAVTGRVPENIDAGTLQQKIDTAFGSGNDSAGQSFKLT
ncbi:MAG: protein translocase subunit SecD, partial [Planctomycetes bacterium]|nr:protein translocase subunit SecD [Planctomycetota bacterium]